MRDLCSCNNYDHNIGNRVQHELHGPFCLNNNSIDAIDHHHKSHINNVHN